MNRKQRRAQAKTIARTSAKADPTPQFSVEYHPDHADSYFARAWSYARSGQIEKAIADYRRGIYLRPATAEGHINLGAYLTDFGLHQAAIESCRRGICLRPDTFEPYSNQGNAFNGLGQHRQAFATARLALRIRPAYGEAMACQGVALNNLRRPAEAVAIYRLASCVLPDLPNIYSSRANALLALERFAEAMISCERALRIKPDFVEAYSNHGTALNRIGRTEDAIASFRRALAIRPAYAEAHSNLSATLNILGQPRAALVASEHAVAINPNFADAHYNQGLMRLLLGDFARGWDQYEWRWRGGIRELVQRNFKQPQWRDQPVAGRTILLHCEQGLGDSLQFCRYAALLAERGARVLLEAPQPLMRLFSHLAGVAQLVAQGDPLPDFDLHCPLLSLPRQFGTSLDTIPMRIPYLAAEPRDIRTWAERLGRPGLKVGLAWRGSAIHKNDRNRSMAFRLLEPLIGGAPASVLFVSLQKDATNEERDAMRRYPRLVDIAGQLGDMADTAAVIANLDLVLSVDTSVGHLAGALGGESWLLLPFAPDWRWLLGRDDSPWYLRHRLFRQSRRGQWDDVLLQVAAALRERAA